MVSKEVSQDTVPLTHRLGEQDEDLPMDLGTVQDIFSFSFFSGRPCLNLFIALLWDIGLPILLYHLLRPIIGQVLAMVVASSPPLVSVLTRMAKERRLDLLGLVAGISFLITGIVSIAEPSEQVATICESITPLMVGLFCLLSLVPIRFGSFEVRPLVYQIASQIMPRQEADEVLQAHDDQRLGNTKPKTKAQKMDWLYTHAARFRTDMRIMTGAWGMMLVIGFVVKVIVVETGSDIGHAQLAGYLIFGLITICMSCFTWIYSSFVNSHICQQVAFWREHPEAPPPPKAEAALNLNWGVNAASNAFGQAMG
ncbi:hypothetical protein J3Q64DRAFT_1745744 [Phycomyces blakesleeanus]